jgi:transposase
MTTKSIRKIYNTEFKVEAIKLIESEGYSLAEGSIRLGVGKSTLSKWKALYSHNRDIGDILRTNPKNGLSIFEQKQLEEELARVKKERDILKKALAYFAAEPQ